MYEKTFNEEVNTAKKEQNDIIKDKRKQIRDDFLNNFYLPLREEYDDNIDKYKALFPIKEKDMAEEPITYKSVFLYGEVIS